VDGELVLEGDHVRLEPLTMAHADALLVAAGEDQSSYEWTRAPVADPAGVIAFLDDIGNWPGRIAFATVWKDEDRVVGSTSFFAEWWNWAGHTGPPAAPDAVEIGGTWLAASAQRTVVNTEAKLLMLTHAFDVWRVQRVALKTDVRNARSRAAIERLGASFEGVLRRHMPALGPGGGVRDSALFSILPDEWPDVRRRLEERLRAGGSAPPPS
jgi:RimJ/RimL family protein N-acetyltransferase